MRDVNDKYSSQKVVTLASDVEPDASRVSDHTNFASADGQEVSLYLDRDHHSTNRRPQKEWLVWGLTTPYPVRHLHDRTGKGADSAMTPNTPVVMLQVDVKRGILGNPLFPFSA